MLNLHELESRWLHYKIKSYVPHMVILISLIIIVFIISSLNFTINDKFKTIAIKDNPTSVAKKTEVVKEISNSITEKPIVKEEVQYRIKKETPIVLSDENTKIKLVPSMNFIKSIKNDSPTYYEESAKIIKNSYQKEKLVKQRISKSVKKEVETMVEAPEVEIVQDSIINIKRRDTNDDIQHVIKRFKKSNNPALSLFIAKKYYERQDYNQAYNYSLITNEINNNVEDSWIIFAKSLVKLDKKDKAIAMLNKYIDHSNSQKAKLLLDNIKSGTIK